MGPKRNKTRLMRVRLLHSIIRSGASPLPSRLSGWGTEASRQRINPSRPKISIGINNHFGTSERFRRVTLGSSLLVAKFSLERITFKIEFGIKRLFRVRIYITVASYGEGTESNGTIVEQNIGNWKPGVQRTTTWSCWNGPRYPQQRKSFQRSSRRYHQQKHVRDTWRK